MHNNSLTYCCYGHFSMWHAPQMTAACQSLGCQTQQNLEGTRSHGNSAPCHLDVTLTGHIWLQCHYSWSNSTEVCTAIFTDVLVSLQFYQQ